MDREQLAKFVADNVDSAIKQNQEDILQMLTAELEAANTWEEALPKMMTASIRIAAQVAVQITLDLLSDSVPIHLEPAAPSLRLIRGGLDDPSELANSPKPV